MYRKSFPAPLKWMKPTSGVNGKTNEKRSEITALNGEEERRNNWCWGFFVIMILPGPKLLMKLELKLCNHLSQGKFQPVPSFVQIPGKHIPVSLHVDTFIILSITVKTSIAMEKEIISMVWKDSGGYLKRKLVSKVVSDKKNCLSI